MWILIATIVHFIRRRGKPNPYEKGLPKEETQARLTQNLVDMLLSALFGYLIFVGIVFLLSLPEFFSY